MQVRPNLGGLVSTPASAITFLHILHVKKLIQKNLRDCWCLIMWVNYCNEEGNRVSLC